MTKLILLSFGCLFHCAVWAQNESQSIQQNELSETTFIEEQKQPFIGVEGYSHYEINGILVDRVT